MSLNHTTTGTLPLPQPVSNGCYYKLSLVSSLLFYIANGELDLSRAALLGAVEILDEVAESLQTKEVRP
jgi:hypothetical protein